MLKGICILSAIPMRIDKSDKSEMINQILFGETFKIIKKLAHWSYIQLDHDQYTGWVDNKQYKLIDDLKNKYIVCNKKNTTIKIDNIIQPLIIGSLIPLSKSLISKFKISHIESFIMMSYSNECLTKLAKQFLNTPYVWGGRTIFGVDCSGFTQMVYRLFNIQLPRDAYQQAEIGYLTKDIKVGNLAFFGKSSKINHVGIILKNNKIIHASGQVKIDKIDNTGIFNEKLNIYTHHLKCIKKIFNN